MSKFHLLVLLTLGSVNAHALPPIPTSKQLPNIEDVLKEAGWSMTPEMSAAYSEPGNIFDADNALLQRGADCFTSRVQESAYASMEVNRSLEAGVRMRVVRLFTNTNVEASMHKQVPLFFPGM